jgi:hypothetical protein
MANPNLSIRVTTIDIVDPDGVGPLACTVGVQVTNADASAAPVGFQQANDVRPAMLSRAAFNALVGALRRPNTDTWRDDLVAHPVQKAP